VPPKIPALRHGSALMRAERKSPVQIVVVDFDDLKFQVRAAA
jgi:hypothetical protein